MDAAQALRHLRKRCGIADEETLPSFYEIDATYKAVFEEWATDGYEYAVPTAQVVVFNPAHLHEKAQELERLRIEYQQPPPQPSSTTDPSNQGTDDVSEYNIKHTGLKQLSASHLTIVLTHPLDMLHDLVKGYFHLRSQSALTSNEQSFCNHVEQVVLGYLIQMTLKGGDFLGDVHAFFLELILRQSDNPPMLAFTLLYNLNIALDGNAAQVELFFILLDMVDRLVHLSRPIGTTTLPLITGTLVSMVRPAPGEYLPDRLIAVPFSNFIALLQDPTSQGRVAVMEMLVMSLYLRHMLNDDHQQDTYGARKSKERFHRGMPSSVCPVDPRSGMPIFDLDTIDPNDANSTIDILLHHYFTTSSIAVHRLIFMVIFDLAKANVQVPFAALEHALATCLDQGLASVIATFPTVLLPAHLTRLLGRLDAKVDNDLLVVLTEVAQVARVRDYFDQCSTLAQIVQKRRWLDVSVVNTSASAGGGQHLDPVQRAMFLIGSAVPEERFKGQFKATLPLILKEANAVAKTWVDHANDFSSEDADVAWAALMEFVLSMCSRQLSFVHRRARQLLGTQVFQNSSTEAASIIRALAHGSIALDRELLQELTGDCYLAALHALARCPTSGVAGVVSMVVKAMNSDGQQFARLGGIAKFRAFLEAPHSPLVSLHVAELIVSMVRGTNKDVYFAALKDLHLQAQDVSDERVLDNPYVHCRQLLTRLYHTSKIPID
ncbi:hypothetical protein DYB32_006085 [Aphanomyces invadans]|uniref:Uncharacterized protein n=1 Tax=Aphanomyces invadans TaxID=157072 RepID=A0A3R6Y8H3_9STRA|nr:hypothetical protein DYB32_006085 [Aphanomyces invadans]